MISIRSSAFSARRSTVAANAKRHLRRFESTAVSSEASTAAESNSGVPIPASLAAAVAGVGVVGAAAFVVERSTAEKCPPYNAGSHAGSHQQRFDQGTFGGRFARMLLACDPTLLLHGEAAVRAAQERLRDAATNAASGACTTEDGAQRSAEESRSLWESKRIVESAVHPDTGEFIPRPFRMSGYVPYNGPICVSMVASTSIVPLLFWSWINQSQNALVNYYNRNASSPMTNETLLKSYSAAVGSALVVAFGLSTLVQKRCTPARAKQLMKYVAFPSAVVASSLNCYVVRSPEIDTGVPLMDRNGKPVEMDNASARNDKDDTTTNSSRIAARRGVESTTASRALLQAPVYFLPSLLMGVLPPLKQFLEKHPRARVPVTTFMVLVSFGLGLPATIAIFPQVAKIAASDAEPKYRRLIDPETQRPYEAFYYNKGL